MSSNNELVDYSIHEAAHAVIAEKLGFYVNGIRVNVDVSDGEQAGSVDVVLDESREAAIVYAAGEAGDFRNAEAVKRWNSRSVWKGLPRETMSYYPTMSGQDAAGVGRYLRANYYYGKTELNRIRAEARRMVWDNWYEITNVASALVDASRGFDSAKLDRAGFLAALNK